MSTKDRHTNTQLCGSVRVNILILELKLTLLVREAEGAQNQNEFNLRVCGPKARDNSLTLLNSGKASVNSEHRGPEVTDGT